MSEAPSVVVTPTRVNISDAHFLTALRDECEQDFTYFARYFFKVRKGSSFIFSDHHHLICQDLMAMWRGEPGHRNTIENLPPRYSKTELCIVLFVAWCFVRNPRCEFIHLSYSNPLVLDNSDAIKDVMKSAEFQQLWPHIVIKGNKDSKQAWDTVQGGKFYATASGGSVTGFGAGRMDEVDPETGVYTFSGCLLIDDPLKPDDARHDTIREGINQRWEGTIKSRRNSPATPTLLIMQRIHQKDFTAHVLQDTAEPWFHRRLCALIDEGMPTERALWPAKHTVATLKAMKYRTNDRGQANPIAGETFAGQYQQDPRPAGGGIYREDWWRFYANREQVIKRCTWFCITADTAYTKEDANDPSGFYFWGAEGRDRLYLLDRLHGRWEFPELLMKASEFWEAHPQALRFYIEAKASGMSLAQALTRNRTKEQRARGTQVRLWKPKDYRYPEDKVGRAKKSSWQVFNGCVWLPSDTIAPWVLEFVDEHSAFTADDTHAHDEDVDGQTMAVSVWTHHGGGMHGDGEEKSTEDPTEPGEGTEQPDAGIGPGD